MIRYAVYFVPNSQNRKKILPIRAKLCKKYKNYENMQHPLHMTLTLSVSMHKYKEFEKELRELCSKQKPLILKSKSNMTDIILPWKWSGITIRNSEILKKFQKKVQLLVNRHAIKKEVSRFSPHISLVYGLDKPIDLTGIKPIKLPVTKFNMDKVTICKQRKAGAKYHIYKHIRLSQTLEF